MVHCQLMQIYIQCSTAGFTMTWFLLQVIICSLRNLFYILRATKKKDYLKRKKIPSISPKKGPVLNPAPTPPLPQQADIMLAPRFNINVKVYLFFLLITLSKFMYTIFKFIITNPK